MDYHGMGQKQVNQKKKSIRKTGMWTETNYTARHGRHILLIASAKLIKKYPHQWNGEYHGIPYGNGNITEMGHKCRESWE